MKYIKNRKEFLYENNVLDFVSYDIDQAQQDTFEDYGTDTEDWVETQCNTLGLIKGNIIFHRRYYEVIGKDNDGYDIVIQQKGEYDMYGGPYDPKMERPVFTMNGIDVYPIIKFHFIKDGMVSDKNEVDMTRSDMFDYGLIEDYLKMPEEERANFLKSLNGIDKFKL